MDLQPITQKQLHILRHSLGLDDAGQGTCYRNHFVADRNGPDAQQCQALCAAGYMEDAGETMPMGGMHCYFVTAAGKDLVFQNRPPTPKLTPGQRRYREFLDADSGETFREWLFRHDRRRKETRFHLR